MTEAEALAIADKPDWWVSTAPGQQTMRTLRQALAEAVSAPGGQSPSLFRPGGFGQPAIWLSAEEIARLHTLLAGASAEPSHAAL